DVGAEPGILQDLFDIAKAVRPLSEVLTGQWTFHAATARVVPPAGPGEVIEEIAPRLALPLLILSATPAATGLLAAAVAGLLALALLTSWLLTVLRFLVLSLLLSLTCRPVARLPGGVLPIFGTSRI